MPPLLGLQNQQWEGVFSKSVQWELSPEGGFQEGMGPQGRSSPEGAQNPGEDMVATLSKKSQKTCLQDKGKSSSMRKWLFPTPADLHLLLSGFCLPSDSSSSHQRHLQEKSFQSILQRKEAIQQCWSRPGQRPKSFGVRNNDMRSEPSQDKVIQRSMLPEHNENTEVKVDD